MQGSISLRFFQVTNRLFGQTHDFSRRLCCKNRLEGEERLASSRYAANPNSWLMTRFWARTSPLAIPSIWPLRSMCMAS